MSKWKTEQWRCIIAHASLQNWLDYEHNFVVFLKYGNSEKSLHRWEVSERYTCHAMRCVIANSYISDRLWKTQYYENKRKQLLKSY